MGKKRSLPQVPPIPPLSPEALDRVEHIEKYARYALNACSNAVGNLVKQMRVTSELESWDYGEHAEIVFPDGSLYSWTEP